MNKKVYLLSKDNCPQCTSLKLFLKMGARGKYDSIIEVIHKEENLDKFPELVEKHEVMMLPTLIGPDGTVLSSANPSSVTAFLDPFL